MKRFMLLTFVLLLIFTAAMQAQDKPKIFINTNSTIGQFIAVNTGFAQFANIARNLGYTVDHGLHPSIKPEYLEGVDVYVLSSPTYSLLNSEKVALRQFIRGGGTVIVLAWVVNFNLSSFTEEFGIMLGAYGYVVQNGYIVTGASIDGPNEVKDTYHVARREIEITDLSKADALVKVDDGTIVGAEAKGPAVGKGKLLVFTCVDSWANKTVGGCIETNDNAMMVKNVLDYCKGKQDLAVTFVKPKGVKPEPGDDVKLVVKVKNLGSKTSSKTKLAFYITDNGLLEDPAGDTSPSEVIKRLAVISMPEIAPGKVKRIITRGKVPSWVAPGEYILLAEVDPNNSSGDSDITNNVKAAKKALIVK